MKHFKRVAATMALAATALTGCLFTSCGSSTIEGTYTHSISFERYEELAEDGLNFWGAGFWDMGLSFVGIDAYNMENTIEFTKEGTYTYTMISVLADPYDASFDRTATAYLELIYTGTYTAGSESSSYVLAFPTECVWSYNAGLFAALHSDTTLAYITNAKYSEGSTTIKPFGDMSENLDVMSAFGYEVQVLTASANTSTTLTVYVDSSASTFDYSSAA